MKLKLKLNGSAEPFINYLKSYLRIRESLLLEIDTENRAFVAKTSTQDKSAIRFASITFDESKISIVSDDGENERNGTRIKVGILLQLKKFIQIVERFGSEVDKEGNSEFDIIISYEPYIHEDNTRDFVSTQVQFVSKTLKMKIDGFRITDLSYIPDDDFVNKIFNLSESVSCEITSEKVNNIIKNSEIVKMDPRKDTLIFFNEGKSLNVKSYIGSKDKEPDFEYKIGELDAEPNYEIELPINREKFIKMLDKSTESFKLILGKYIMGDYNEIDRLLFDSVNSTTKIVIGAVRDK